MKNFIKNFLIITIFIVLFFLMLSHAEDTKQYALLGLNIWYQHMLPALLPFMILSGLLIDLKLDKILIKPFKIFIQPVFKISDAGIYTMFMGFLCGFPMGARIAALEYKEGNMTLKEAEYLLCFCNNFGPAYYFSFIYLNIYAKEFLFAGLFLLYGLPFLYGFFLRYTFYRKDQFYQYEKAGKSWQSFFREQHFQGKQIIRCINSNIIKSLTQIGILGGYMILCNMLTAPLSAIILRIDSLFPRMNETVFITAFHCIFEISGGIMAIKNLSLSGITAFICSHIALAFNGLSCHLQTFNMIADCPLSRKKYMLHKINLCSITCIILLILFKIK